MKRKKLHKLLDAVLDITDGGEGVGGYPYVAFGLTNFGTPAEIYIMDNGFVSLSGYDGHYCFFGDDLADDKQTYKDCMAHLKRLKKGIDNGR